SGHTLQPADLVNEAYLRLIEWNAVGWRNRAHFYAVAAKMMGRVLVSRAIARRRQKRGGSAVLVSLTEAGGVPHRSADVIAPDGRSRRVLEPGRARASTYVARRASLMIPPSNELHGDLGLPRGPEGRIWLGSNRALRTLQSDRTIQVKLPHGADEGSRQLFG